MPKPRRPDMFLGAALYLKGLPWTQICVAPSAIRSSVSAYPSADASTTRTRRSRTKLITAPDALTAIQPAIKQPHEPTGRNAAKKGTRTVAYTYGTSQKALRPSTPDQEQPAPKLAPVVQAKPKPEPAPKPVRPLKPCGTNAAYVRHFKRHEDPCIACTEARREYVAEHRKSRTRRRAEAKCGTYPGAVRHYRNKESPCGPCAKARREYVRKYRAQKAFDTAYAAAMEANPNDANDGPIRLAHLDREIEQAAVRRRAGPEQAEHLRGCYA